jgi:UDP:flavonoid glycosyltransferase YjiC (YdhE family)
MVGTNVIPGRLPAGAPAFPYAPFSKIVPLAAGEVHQGGIGACGQAMAPGKPMLIMTYGFDQLDNAARLERLGVAGMSDESTTRPNEHRSNWIDC